MSQDDPPDDDSMFQRRSLDPYAATWFDQDHSTPDDLRFIHLGYSTNGRLLFLVHNENDGSIRLISARPATQPNETFMKKPEKTTPPLPKVIRGKYTNLLQQGTNLIILDPALMPHFPDSASVNRALHAFLAINDHVRSAAALPRSRRRPAASAEPAFDPRVGTRTASR